MGMNWNSYRFGLLLSGLRINILLSSAAVQVEVREKRRGLWPDQSKQEEFDENLIRFKVR